MVADSALRVRAEQAASSPAPLAPVRGALSVDASWSGGGDLDVSIVSPQGARTSWTGGRAVSAESVADAGRERIALRSAGRGSWLIEIGRTRPGDTTPVSGSLRIRAYGAERTVPFRLEGDRIVVARVDVTRQFRLEEVMR